MLNEMDTLATDNLITGPEVGASVKPQQNSLARELIVKYVAGKDPNKDKIAQTEDLNEDAAAPVTSRAWSNREAKKAAKQFLINPKTHFSTTTFDEIWGHVLKAEGGYANNPADPGGETKYGISKRSYPTEDIANITPQRAQEIFKNDFYDAVGGESLMKINPGLAAHVSDMAFNAGPKSAVKLLYDAVQLPRQSQITPELLDRLNESENLIKDYSVARLKYYSSLGNAPTFIKGWVNRVNNLNKALQVKSGLNGAYKAARQLDVGALVDKVYSAQDQLAPRFRELDQVEIERLQRANEMLSPGYVRPSSVKPKEASSLGEVFKATYDAKYYTNTIDGMNELALRSAREASDANRKAMGDKFDPGLVEKMTVGLYGGVNSIQDWETEVKKFKAANPNVKLPFETAAQVYELSQKKAKEIEDRYNAVDSGNFKDGIAASLNKLGHVVAGYLPGEVLGALGDRTEGALALAPLPGTTTVAGVAKGVAAVMAGTGAAQAVVQPKRQELGLEGGLQQGLENTAMAGVGQAVVGSLVGLATKLWRSGSKETAREIFKETERMKRVVKDQIPDAQTLQLQRAVAGVEDHAKELQRNPFGPDHQAKLQYEQARADAFDDIINGRPVREMDVKPVAVIDNTEKLTKQMQAMYSDAEAIPDFQSGIKEWTEFKKSAVATNPKFEATVPLEGPTGVQRFQTKEQLDAYLQGEGKALFAEDFIVQEQAADGTWYAARPANLEGVDSPTTRFAEDAEVAGNVRGFIGSEDLELAKKYPDLVKTNTIEAAPPSAPLYPEIDDVLGRAQYLNELDTYGSAKLTNLDKRYEASLLELQKLTPETMLDLGDEVESGVKLSDVLGEIKEERSALSEMFSCMVGGPATEGV